MSNQLINDLDAASAVSASMQIETDTGGTTSEKITITQVQDYLGNGTISNDATTTRTLALTDRFDHIVCTAAMTITVPAEASVDFDIGAEIYFIQNSSNQITFSAAGGVTITSLDGNVKTSGQGAFATLKKIASDTWALFGDLSS